MMRKNITRTLTRSTIHAFGVKMVDGKPELVTLEPVTAWGKVDEKEAMKAIKEAHGSDISVTIGEIEHVDETYKIDIDTFVANAVKVEKDEADSEESEENN